MKHFVWLLLSISLLGNAQKVGIQFEKNKTWKEILAKAASEKKNIMIDCFATWCGPCKYMSNTVFPQAEAGSFYNANFINVKVQMDETEADDAYVKSWYATAKEMGEKYRVDAYPTYLFLSPTGELLHKFVGATDAAGFVEKGKAALDPSKQFFTLQKKYNSGNREAAFLKAFASAADEAGESDLANEVANLYLATQKDLLTKENLEFILQYTTTSTTKGFDVVQKNTVKADAVLGEYKASRLVIAIITNEEIFSTIKKGYVPTVTDWVSYEKKVTAKYPSHSTEAIQKAKIIVHKFYKNWTSFLEAVFPYMEKFGVKEDAAALNDYAFNVFDHSGNTIHLNKALEWSKRSLVKEQIAAYLDTYANILYRLGKKTEAIEWQTKAVNAANDADEKEQYQEMLNKMKKGEKTWVE